MQILRTLFSPKSKVLHIHVGIVYVVISNIVVYIMCMYGNNALRHWILGFKDMHACTKCWTYYHPKYVGFKHMWVFHMLPPLNMWVCKGIELYCAFYHVYSWLPISKESLFSFTNFINLKKKCMYFFNICTNNILSVKDAKGTTI
jgi:hypothetical protein